MAQSPNFTPLECGGMAMSGFVGVRRCNKGATGLESSLCTGEPQNFGACLA